jgi:pectinesterase
MNHKYLLKSIIVVVLFLSNIIAMTLSAQSNTVLKKNWVLSPEPNTKNSNPDTHLEILFNSIPEIGSSGEIRIYDAQNNKLIDKLDLSIPAGPTTRDTLKTAIYTPVPYEYASSKLTNGNTKPGTPSGIALPTSDKFQLTIIGHFTDGFHFYPIIVKGNNAIIYPHNNLLEYGKKYYVEIDPGVLNLQDGSFNGITKKDSWIFTTKSNPPKANSNKLVVDGNGTGDFNTVQGAFDFISDFNQNRTTILVKNGIYEEIVYFRNKSNVTIVGESRDGVVIQYANNEVFNPHPINVKTNELLGTFPSRRAAFSADNCKGIHFENLTIKTTIKGQAEGLLINGEENILSNVTIVGSGDALQTNGSAYYTNCHIVGDGDTILGRGTAYFDHCEINSYGAYMWIRNTANVHGNVFVDCAFKTLGGRETEIARSPTNKGADYPFAEVVLINCTLSGISKLGWGPFSDDISNLKIMEFKSHTPDGKPIDFSKRHPAARNLSVEKDGETISNYKNPCFVFKGWTPDLTNLNLDIRN